MANTKILVVDDKYAHRKFIGDVLQAKGYEVKEVESAALARQELLTNNDYSLMVLDYMMKKQTGTEFLKEMRTSAELSHYRDMPVIFITAYAEDEKVQEAEEGPNVSVLPKPFRDYHDILDAVDQALNK